MKWLKHLKTITHHKKLVMEHCFKVGLYYQGLTHDLSKYSPVEFFSGARFFQGDRSPNDAERKATAPPGCTIKDATSIIWNIGSIIARRAIISWRVFVCRKNMWRRCSATAWLPAKPTARSYIQTVTLMNIMKNPNMPI